MKRVLVTGATGFVGRYAPLFLLSRGYEVHAVSSRPAASLDADSRALAGVTWHQADLLDERQRQAVVFDVQPTHLLHLAWYAEHGKFWTSPENLRWVRATLDLAQCFAEAGGRRIVAAGTCAEYDWAYGYCSEGVTPLTPATLYGTCKHASQMMLSSFARQVGVSMAWGRVFFLYGPHEHPNRLVSSVILSLLTGQPARTSEGRQIRDFLHVEDVASAFVALLDSDVEGPVNIASGQPVALRDVIFKIASIIGGESLVRLGEVAPRPDDPCLLVADVTRLRAEVCWSPGFSLDRGLQETIEWWRLHNGQR
jgi:nucleoside-diphosphate-sugar epimerase